jgi:hypothetical protein
MNFTRMKWAAGALGVLLLAACNSGGGGAVIPPTAPGSSLSITTIDALGTRSTFTADSSNSIITAHSNADEGQTIIEICSDVNKDNDCSRLMVLTIDGTSAQKYTMASIDSPSQIVYHDDESAEGASSHYVSHDGEIDVSSMDTSGKGFVKGTFSANLACTSGCSGVIAVSGNYNVALNR